MDDNKKTDGQLLRQAVEEDIKAELEDNTDAAIAEAMEKENMLETAIKAGVVSKEDAKIISSSIIANMENQLKDALEVAVINESVVDAVAKIVKKAKATDGKAFRAAIEEEIEDQMYESINISIDKAIAQAMTLGAAVETEEVSVDDASILANVIIANLKSNLSSAIEEAEVSETVVATIAEAVRDKNKK